MKRLQAMGSLDIWYLHAHVDRASPLARIDPKTQAIVAKAAAKARAQTNTTLIQKIAERRASGAWQFRTDPPILTPVDGRPRRR